MDDEVTTLAHKGELLSITDKWKLIDACLSIGIEVTSRHSKFKYAKLIYNYMQKEIRNTDVGRLIKEKYDKKEHKKAHREKKLRKLVAQSEDRALNELKQKQQEEFSDFIRDVKSGAPNLLKDAEEYTNASKKMATINKNRTQIQSRICDTRNILTELCSSVTGLIGNTTMDASLLRDKLIQIEQLNAILVEYEIINSKIKSAIKDIDCEKICMTCSVCFEPYDNNKRSRKALLMCGHVFCKQCICKLKVCSLCRMPNNGSIDIYL